jgi:TetR/AcrR family transcriptional regulator, cholesterol catabolism regulator
LEAKDKILKAAEELFIRYGIRSVTMDDVARDASMSKKTLYQFFDNKDSLVFDVAMNHFEQEAREFEEITNQANDAIHEVLLTSQCLRKHVFRMNPSLLFDMQKYHGKAWDEYLKFKNSTIRGLIKKNIDQGMHEGYFRSGLDSEILSTLRVEQVQLAFDPKIFPTDKFDFTELQLQILSHFIHGLLTDKGRIKYEEYTKSEITNTIP